MTDYSYIGVGKVHLRVAGSAAPLRFVGNVASLAFRVTEDVKELRDYTQPGGGTYNEVRRVQSVESSIRMHDLSPENIALALFGDVSAIAAEAVSNEPHTAYQGGLVKTLFPINTTVDPVVNLAGSPSTLFVEGDDYEVSEAGITIVEGGDIVDGSAIVIDYTKAAGNAVEVLLNSSQEYEMVFAGLNEARSGKAVSVHAYRVKIGAAQEIALIGDEYAAVEVAGKVLKDTTKNGTSVSQYFKVQVVT
jgi:hypothetical protein